MSENWKAELAELLGPQKSPQAGSCETDFLEGLTRDGQELALVFTQRLIDRSRQWIDCRFGAGTPQAQAAFGDIASVISKCALANVGKLLARDWAGYFSAVTACVAGSLLGGGGGSQSGFQDRPVNRCP